MRLNSFLLFVVMFVVFNVQCSMFNVALLFFRFSQCFFCLLQSQANKAEKTTAIQYKRVKAVRYQVSLSTAGLLSGCDMIVIKVIITRVSKYDTNAAPKFVNSHCLKSIILIQKFINF